MSLTFFTLRFSLLTVVPTLQPTRFPTIYNYLVFNLLGIKIVGGEEGKRLYTIRHKLTHFRHGFAKGKTAVSDKSKVVSLLEGLRHPDSYRDQTDAFFFKVPLGVWGKGWDCFVPRNDGHKVAQTRLITLT